jgi:hypothetical protein
MFGCDEARVAIYGEKRFLILGWWRSTRDDHRTQWFHNGEPVHFRYLAETVVASGSSARELLASAKEYKRVQGMSAEDYLKEQIKKGRRKHAR